MREVRGEKWTRGSGLNDKKETKPTTTVRAIRHLLRASGYQQQPFDAGLKRRFSGWCRQRRGRSHLCILRYTYKNIVTLEWSRPITARMHRHRPYGKSQISQKCFKTICSATGNLLPAEYRIGAEPPAHLSGFFSFSSTAYRQNGSFWASAPKKASRPSERQESIK